MNHQIEAFSISTQPSKPKSASAYKWHQILAHASGDAVQHLSSAAEGVEITDKNSISLINQCESCALAKAREIISRRSDNAEFSEAPFHRISYDLIQLEPALNKNQWISHIACYSTDFNILYTHRTKSEASSLVIQVINVIVNRFNRNVAFIRSDDEKSLKNDFFELLAQKRISFEPFAPDTQAQNGHSKRKGGILLIKARVLRIDVGFFHYL